MSEAAAYARRGLIGGAKATTLNGTLAAGGSSIVGTDLSTWAGATANGPICWTVNRGLTDEESGEATGISGNTLTGVTKGLFGTSDQTHTSGTLELTSSKKDYDEANRLVNAIFGIASLAAGDLLYLLTSTTFARLAKGTAYQGLQMNTGATAPTWGTTLASLLTATGDIAYASSANTPARLAAGSNGQGVELASGIPAWKGAHAVSAQPASDQTIPNNTLTLVALGAESFDTDTFHDNVTSNSRETCPSGLAGKYHVDGQVGWTGNATGIRIVQIKVNGVAIRSVEVDNVGANLLTQSISCVVALAAGDYVEMAVQQTSGGNLNLTGTVTVSLDMHRIGGT